MLNTLYIRTFLAVVDAGNYTAAAEQLHMSQPAVSQHIRALEEQLGNVRLFRRVGQRMMPTHAGEELLTAARDLIVLAERTEQNIRALRGQVTGRVTIGCTASSGEYLLPPLLTAFHERHPLVHLEVQVAPGEMLLHALAEHAIALVLIEEQQRRRGWEYHLLGNEGLTLLAPCTHPLLQQEQVSAGELREYPLIVPCPGSPLRRTLEDALRKRGLPMSDWQIVLECDSITMITQAVRNALGLAFVPDMHLAMVPGIERVNLSGTPLHQEWYILRERGHHFPRAAQELFLFLTSAITSTILQRCGLSIPENMKER